MVIECRWSISRMCSVCFVLFCAGQKRLSGYDEMKVEDVVYFHGNVKKFLDNSYDMDFSRCGEDLDED